MSIENIRTEDFFFSPADFMLVEILLFRFITIERWNSVYHDDRPGCWFHRWSDRCCCPIFQRYLAHPSNLLYPPSSVDPNTDSQWKILGMVVSAIMLLTVLVTFCIFIYCYKQGRIIGSNNPNDPFKNQRSSNGQGHDLDQTYPPPYYQPGMGNSMISPIPYGEDMVPVHDKLTNTHQTNASLQRGVWPSNNAYGGYAYRSNVPPKTFSRTIQASPTQFDQQNPLARKNPMGAPNNANAIPIPRVGVPQQPGTRIEYIEDDEFDRARRHRRAVEQPRYEIVEEIVERPMPGEGARRNGKDRSRYERVRVKPISMVEKPQLVEDERATDHFYH